MTANVVALRPGVPVAGNALAVVEGYLDRCKLAEVLPG